MYLRGAEGALRASSGRRQDWRRGQAPAHACTRRELAPPRLAAAVAQTEQFWGQSG